MSKTKFLIFSGKAQRGKDTSAMIAYEELTNSGHKVLIIHYADLLKWMCQMYFNWDGKKDDAGRTILQKVGTDTIRKQDPDYWVRWVIDFIKLFPNEWEYVLIPDCRFPNEIELMKEAFNTVVHLRVDRPGFISPLTYEQQSHISETALDNYPYDILLTNTTMHALREQIIAVIDELEANK